jgi:hypothetical protein
MRPVPLLTTLFLTTITTTQAAAETTIHNKCPFSVYYASVDSSAPDHTTELRPKDYILQDQWFDGKTGTALKITTTKNGMWAGEPVLNFAYTVKDDEVYYDLSTVNGYAFWGRKIVLEGEGSEIIVWDGQPGGVHVAHASGEVDLVLTLCA